MDLFREVVPEDAQHPNFKNTKLPECAGEQAVLADWAAGFVDRDGKFIKEFQTTFNSSFWELYLFACWKRLGFSCDFSHETPDFSVGAGAQDFIAEAVTASHAEGYAPEWEGNLADAPHTTREIRELITVASIRLANSITSKLRKYRENYAELDHVRGKPFVVCVAPFEQPFFFLQNDHALRRVLYAYDQPLSYDDPATGERVVVGVADCPNVIKDSGAEIELGFFTNPDMCEISAVVFSSTATSGKVQALAASISNPIMFSALRYNARGPRAKLTVAQKEEYEESLLDGLHLLLNPFATHPLDVAPFQEREVAIHALDPSTGMYLVDSPDGFLIQRSTLVLRFRDGPRPHRERTRSDHTYKKPAQPDWQEGVLQPVAGSVMMFTDNHMAHYRGWTIVIARDATDSDWGGQAIPGIHYSLPEYLQANAARPKSPWILVGFRSTKEEALAAALSEIDGRLAG